MIEIVAWFILIISFLGMIYFGIKLVQSRFDEKKYYRNMRVLMRLGLYQTVIFKTVPYYDDYIIHRMKQMYKLWD